MIAGRSDYFLSSSSDPLSTKEKKRNTRKKKKERENTRKIKYIYKVCVNVLIFVFINKKSDEGGFDLPKRHKRKLII